MYIDFFFTFEKVFSFKSEKLNYVLSTGFYVREKNDRITKNPEVITDGSNNVFNNYI